MSAMLSGRGVAAIEAVLPQTQCGQCGFEGCTPYAQALIAGEVETDRCPPGGDVVALALARLLERKPIPYDRERGPHLPPQVARVREAECIGCTKCIQACPIDAIIGAAGRMHTVLDEACSGCGLCLPPCPVDCIDLVAVPAAFSTGPSADAGLAPADALPDAVLAAHALRHPQAERWRQRHDARTARLDQRAQARTRRLRAQSSPARTEVSNHLPAAVVAAMARAQERLAEQARDRSTHRSAHNDGTPD